MANVYKTVNGKILLTAPGSGKIAKACCCGAATCETCCENPWRLCVTVSDGTIVAQALVSIVTTLAGCCCSGTGTGVLCKTDGTSIGTVQVELLVTHDGTFARFTVTSAVLATCGAGCISAWVEGTLTGTIPTNCTLSFTPTIARSGTTALTISATDSYTSCNGCDCSNCTTCRGGGATLVVSGIGGNPCAINKMNGTYALTYGPPCGWTTGWKSGAPECGGSVTAWLTCISVTNVWYLTVQVDSGPPLKYASVYPVLNCTGNHPTGSGVFTSWLGCSGGSWTLT